MANGKAYFKINGVRYVPQTMSVIHDSLASADSGRTDDGIMHITFIRENLTKLDITMPPADAGTYTTLISSIQGKANISVTFYDPLTSSVERTITCYCSSNKADWYSGVITSNGILTGLSFSLIEM